MEMYIPSGYEDFGSYRERENLHLVRSRQNQNLYLLKKLDVFDESVLDELIDHPVCGTARIHGRYRVNDSLYTIEEYVSGRTLREVLSQGPVDEEQACTWILELLNVLEPLHHRKPAIVHRDIKPENIMINAQNELILVDFNAAKTVDEEKSKDTVLIGTNGYASPEQYGFQVSSPASDIYAVGVLFREMLTGSLEDTNAYQGKYRKVIDRCLSLDPEKRYRDAGEMSSALTALRERKKTLWRFLPPGFQTKNLVGLWAALAFYYTWFGGALSMEVVGGSMTVQILARFFWFVAFTLDILWTGNYLNIWKKVPLTRSKNLFVRYVGVVLWGLCILMSAYLLNALMMTA